MGRTRTKSKKAANILPPPTEEQTAPSSSSPSSKAPTIESLLEKSRSLVDQCDYELAKRFVERILHRQPNSVEGKEIMGVIQLEMGDLDDAKRTFTSLLPPNPGAPKSPPPSAYLYLAQLSDDPRAALQYYQNAVDIFMSELKGKARRPDDTSDDDGGDETRKNAVRALIGMVEIWMDPSYDLCFAPEAEQTCESLLQLALQTDSGNAEALQMFASVRMSQQRPDDAKSFLEQAWSSWKDLEAHDPKLPPIPTRLALVKLFLELELFTPALLVIHGVMAMDDQEVEAWYLEGWCFFLMAEQAKEKGGSLDDVPWQDLAKDARDCLETCHILHINEDHPDKPLLEHVKELIAQLEALGIHKSPETADEEAEGDWEEEVASEDDDGDVEME